MKRSKADKAGGPPHLVPLALQAVGIPRELQPLTEHGRHVFPALTNTLRELSLRATGGGSAVRSSQFEADPSFDAAGVAAMVTMFNVFRVLACAVAVLAQGGAHAATPLYRIKELSLIGGKAPLPYQINDMGQVLASFYDDVPRLHVVVSQADGRWIEQPVVPAGASLYDLKGLNNAGQILSEYAWFPGSGQNKIVQGFYDPPTGRHVVAETLPGSSGNTAVDLNNVGLVSGFSYTSDEQFGRYDYAPFSWTVSAGRREFKTPKKHGAAVSWLNDRGEAILLVEDGAGYLVSKSRMDKILPPEADPDPAPGYPDVGIYALNNRGQVLGFSNWNSRYFLWDADSGARYIPMPAKPVTLVYCPCGLSDAGEVLARGADGVNLFFGESTGIVPLDSLMDPSDPLLGVYRDFIPVKMNSRGDIVAKGIVRGKVRPVVLYRVDLP